MKAKTEKQLREELEELRQVPVDVDWALTVWQKVLGEGSELKTYLDAMDTYLDTDAAMEGEGSKWKTHLKAQHDDMEREAAADEAAELLREEYWKRES